MKSCKVAGVDLSVKMINCARRMNPHNDIIFLHRDTVNIPDYKQNDFDFTVMCMLIHELPLDKQLEVITELMRLGKKTIIVDN